MPLSMWTSDCRALWLFPPPRLQQQLVLVLSLLADGFLVVLHCQRGYHPPHCLRSISAILFPLFLSCIRPLHAVPSCYLCVTKPTFPGHQTALPIQSDPLPSLLMGHLCSSGPECLLSGTWDCLLVTKKHGIRTQRIQVSYHSATYQLCDFG